jgi:hypothetical protein
MLTPTSSTVSPPPPFYPHSNSISTSNTYPPAIDKATSCDTGVMHILHILKLFCSLVFLLLAGSMCLRMNKE